MNEYEIKIGTVIKFDSEKEKDIIEQIEGLASRKKLGDFISNIIRIAFDNPEFLKSNGKSLLEHGMTEERTKFFKQVDSEVSKMRSKVDEIFDMTYKLYMLALFGKRMGLEKKASNLAQSQFILQRQLEELCTTLGVSGIGHVYESNKLNTFESKAEKVLEYIIEAYDNVVTELVSGVSVVSHVTDENVSKLKDSKNSIINVVERANNNDISLVEEAIDTTKIEQLDKTDKQIETSESGPEKSSEVLDNNKGVNENDDEVIDFGAGADWNALNAFIGG